MKLSIEIPVSYQALDEDMPSLKRDLNMAIAGMYKCNIRNKEGVAIPHSSIDSETYEELSEAHFALSKGGSCTLVVEFDTVNHEWKVVDFK